MTKFNFKLERILDYKKTVEDYKKGEYGLIKQKLNNEKDKLDSFNHHKDYIKFEMNEFMNKTKVGNLAMYNNYLNDISKKIEKQEQIIDQAKEELEAAENEMLIASQEKKAFEKLKEKEYKKHLYELKKIEENQIDTLVSYRTSTQ